MVHIKIVIKVNKNVIDYVLEVEKVKPYDIN